MVRTRLLAEPRAWQMTGPDWASSVTFYEDFPYSYWQRFDASRGLEARYTAELPPTIGLTPELADIVNTPAPRYARSERRTLVRAATS